MDLFKNLKLIILLGILAISIFLIVSPLLSRRFGVFVLSIEKDSLCNLKEGDVITAVSGYTIKNSEDFQNAEKNAKKGEYTAMIVNNGPGGCVAARDGYFGINVMDVPSEQIVFGIEIQGGITSLYRPKSGDIEQIVEIVKKRSVSLNMPETKIDYSDNILKITSLSAERNNLLVMPGNFEAKIAQMIEIKNNICEIKIGDTPYHCELIDKKLKVNDSLHDVNETIFLEGINFDLINITNTSATLEAIFFKNEDIVRVLSAYGYSRYNPNFQAYEYAIPVEVSDEASERFQRITKGMKVTSVGGQIILEGSLVFYLDDEFINRLNIPFEMAGKKLRGNNIYISSIKNNKKQAETEKLKIQTVLESGKLPKLNMIGFEDFAPPLKEQTVNLILIFSGITIAIVLSVVYLEYKKIILGGLILLLILIQTICIVGVARITQKLSFPGWVLDFYSILGMLGVAVVSMVNMFASIEYERRKGFVFKISSLNLAIFSISFLLLFTSFRGFGLSMIVGLLLTITLVTPIHNQFSKKFFT